MGFVSVCLKLDVVELALVGRCELPVLSVIIVFNKTL